MSSQRAYRYTLLLPLIFALVLFTGCGGDDGGGPAAPAQPVQVSGQVVKGPVSGSTVTLNAITDANTPGAVRGGPFTTDANGAWSGEIPAGTSGPFLIVATGGSYVDEASSETVALGSTQLLGFSTNGSGTVSPYTHALSAAAAARGGSASAAWNSVLSKFETAFGFDPSTTSPALGSGAPGESYFALLGGLSNLLDSSSALSGLTGAATIDLVLALATDLSDGRFDGLDASGGAILVPGSGGPLSWPALDATGIQVLIDAVNAWAATIEGLEGFSLSPTVLDLDPTTTGNGSGSITFSGPGASLLSSTTFEPAGFSTNQLALAWASTNGTGYGGSVGVARSPSDPTKASLISVTIVEGQNSYGWNVFAFETSVPGVTLDGNTVTFDDVILPAITGTQLSLTINGVLGE